MSERTRASTTLAASAPARHLVVFSDDWGRHPSSAQHLVRELLATWRVTWVQTIGTRRPTLSAADFARALEKLRQWTRRERAEAPQTLPPNLTIAAPIHWPGFGSGLERRLNAQLFDRALGDVCETADAVVATAPIVADFAARRPRANWIYYCVDDLAEWPGLDARALRALERDFVPRAARIVAVSHALQERLLSFGRTSELLTHGIELAHWALPAARAPRPQRERPVTLFWGVADRRLDEALVLELARTSELHFVGPRHDVAPRLLAETSITWRGAVPYARLPELALEADVLVMPYADSKATRAMQPLKLKEYLATLLPVVATSLPANREWMDALDLADEPRAFAACVHERAFRALPAAQIAARARLRDETWAAKAVQFERYLSRTDGAA